jgi:hypothetical protein
VLAVGEVAEHRLNRPRPLTDEEELVALPVAVKARALLRGPAERNLEVAVPHEAATTVDWVAAGLERPGHQMAVDVGIGHPLAVLDRRELTRVGDPAGGGVVVKDRLVAREPLVAHHLLDQQRTASVGAIAGPKLRVALGGDLSEGVVSHDSSDRIAV